MKSKGSGDLVKPRLRAKPEKGTKMVLSDGTKKEAMEAAQYGMPIDRIAILCGFPAGNQTQWHRWIAANPRFQLELDKARAQGELLLQRKIMSGEANWQSAGWMLERTRGYVARASLEHTGKGGKELSVSGNLLGAFGGQSK
jgi:alkylated DNA nucleotide flippase Atl1